MLSHSRTDNSVRGGRLRLLGVLGRERLVRSIGVVQNRDRVEHSRKYRAGCVGKERGRDPALE